MCVMMVVSFLAEVLRRTFHEALRHLLLLYHVQDELVHGI